MMDLLSDLTAHDAESVTHAEPTEADVTWLLRETDQSTAQADEENRADWALHHAEFWNGSL